MGPIQFLYPEPSAPANALLAEAHGRFLQANLLVSPVVGAVGAAILIPHTPGRLLVTAIAVMIVSAGLRSVALARIKPSTTAERVRLYAITNAIGGVTWGLFFTLTLPAAAAAQSWVAVAVPFAMMANMVEAAPVARSFLGFHVPFTAITALTWAVRAEGSTRWVAIVFVLMGAYVVVLARMTHREAYERAELTVRNGELVEQLETANAELQRESHIDRLTNVPNRRALERFLSDAFAERSVAIADGQGSSEIVALFVDLDGFKTANDSLGHHVGDEVLRITANRLAVLTPEDAFLARYGGDEFVVVLRGCASIEPGLELADEIVDGIGEPFSLSVPPIDIGASVGVAITSDTSRDARALLHDADIALYRAKSAGRSCWMTAG